MSRNGKTTTVQADNPKDTVFELIAQVPGQVKKASKPRKRKAPRRPSNSEQRTLLSRAAENCATWAE